MKVHELKTVQPYYDKIVSGKKRFEYRKNDRDFQIGDVLCLKEYNYAYDSFTGNSVIVKVLDLLKDFDGLNPDYCILSISDPI